MPQLGVEDEMARDLVVPPAQHNQPRAAQHGQMLGGHRGRDADFFGNLHGHARFAGDHFRQNAAPQRRADGLKQRVFVRVQMGGNGAGGGNGCIWRIHLDF